MTNRILYTIGYEGASAEDFWATLASAGVHALIDVRQVPVSRKSGFSKRHLKDAADVHGLYYVHFGGLGDPKEGRAAARRGNIEQFKAIFHSHMKSEAAEQDLRTALSLAVTVPSCLMCFERNPQECHRMIVVDHMMWYEAFEVRHLGVPQQGRRVSGQRHQYSLIDDGGLVNVRNG